MAIQRLLALIGGRQAEYVPIAVGAGAASAGQVLAANAAGQIDQTFMPSGIGPDTQLLIASEAISAGALVNIWSNAGVSSARNADGSTSGKQADGFVLAAAASGAQATVYLSGLDIAVSGLAPGLAYLSDTAVGATMSAGAVTAGHSYQQVGVVTAAGALQFAPQVAILRA